MDHSTSVKVYRVIIPINISIKSFALSNKNCIVSKNTQWRCTHHGDDFTINIFKASKLSYPAIVVIIFSQHGDINDILIKLQHLFGVPPLIETLDLLNWVEKFYPKLNENINLDYLYTQMNIGDSDEVFVLKRPKKNTARNDRLKKMKRYYEKPSAHEQNDNNLAKLDNRKHFIFTDSDGSTAKLKMNRQLFSALIVQPFPEESNVKIEIYYTGIINVAGIPSKEYFHKIKYYLNNRLLPLMKESQLSKCTTNDMTKYEEDELLNIL